MPITPLSFQQILSNAIDTFLSRQGASSMNVGSPILRLLETTSQGQFRGSSSVFQLLRSQNIDQADGDALQKIAAGERLTVISESLASGSVTVGDSNFTKISTKVYQGTPAPIVGTTILYVQDASKFNANGSVYIGRGTSNFEGPIAYASVASVGSYWRINLSTATQVFHNLNEPVVMAQGGNRTINSGLLVQNSLGNAATAAQFSIQYSTIMPDGETEVTNVPVIATTPGTVGNVTAGAINAFVSAPFAGATVTNPNPFTNGTANESNDALRERIKNVRASRSQGTPLAIKTGVIGLTSPDENKRIVSASVVTRPQAASTLYIDDGTGYEEKDEGIAFETLVANAIGGEQYFQVAASLPVAKAFAETTITSPYSLQSGAILAVTVSGITYEHTFDPSTFINIGNATAFEVTSSINDDINFPFSARPTNSGTRVAIFADQDTDESLQVTTPSNPTDINANDFLGLPTNEINTLNLYKNDQLLSKDGRKAVLVSASQSAWSNFTGSQTLQIRVDGADPLNAAPTYTITAADFIAAGTTYTSVNSGNNLASWAKVLNFKIPGITATVSGSKLTLVSNSGTSAKAALDIISGSLVAGGVFTTVTGLTSTGLPSDYNLDRNRGQIFLTKALQPGDTITIGTSDARAFIQSSFLAPTTLLSTANLWFVVDGAPTIVQTGIDGAATLTSTTGGGTPATRVRWTATGTNAPYFSGNIAVGDWAIFTDDAFNAANLGAWRIDYVDVSGNYFECSRSSFTAEAVIPSATGLTFVRTTAYPQLVSLTAAVSLTATALAPLISAGLVGGFAEVYKTNYLRVRTDTYGSGGDIALVATNPRGSQLLLPVSGGVSSTAPIPASVISVNPEYGTPNFLGGTMTGGVSTSAFSVTTSTFGLAGNSFIVSRRSLPENNAGSSRSRYGNNLGYEAVTSTFTGGQVNLRKPVLEEFLASSRYYVANSFGLGPLDNLSVLIDGDASEKRYTFNTYRRIKPTTSTYGSSNSYFDIDNANAKLTDAFGVAFNFQDFALITNARAKSHAESGDTTKTVLWRAGYMGALGNQYKVHYAYPVAASQPTTVYNDAYSDALNEVYVRLPSAGSRSGYTVRNTTKIGHIVATSGSLQQITFFLGLKISSASRTTNVTTLTLDVATPGATDHGFVNGNIVYVNSTNINFASGLYTVTSHTPTTILYTETAADQGATANIGDVSFDVAQATLTGSTATAGDILNFSSATSLSAWEQVPMRSTAISVSGQYWQGLLPTAQTPATVIVWETLGNTSGFSIYPLLGSSNTAADIASAVNALAAAPNSVCPVTAVAVGLAGVATGVINRASYEDSAGTLTPGYGYQLSDAVNYVNVVTYPANPTLNYTLSFKLAITASLATNSDWLNQELRLVPITALNTVNYLNCPAVSGLFSAATVESADRGGHIEITSNTLGNSGSVQVQGGTATSAGGSVVSNATSVSGDMVFTMNLSDAEGLFGSKWVRLQNAGLANRPVFTSGMSVNTIATNGTFTMSSPVWSTPRAALANKPWQIEKQGDYVAFVWADPVNAAPSLTALSEGDWVVTDATAVTAPAISAFNIGTFRIVAINDTQHTFWIQNVNAVEEVIFTNMTFVGGDSIMPGDMFSLSTSAYGAEKVGTWLVTKSWAFGGGNEGQFQVSATFSLYTGPTALGANAPLWVDAQGVADNFTKQLITISPNQLDSTLADVKVSSSYGYANVGPSTGTVVVALDKLGFASGLATGTEAYEHATGLIGTANKVAYGDPADPTLYPGIVAAGANLNISGPLIRRIQVALQIRVINGITVIDVINKVKSAVAAVINNTKIGQPIAISDICDAASAVNGVQAVTIISPTWNSANDLIDVQPFEKPLVLSLDQDVTVTLIGA